MYTKDKSHRITLRLNDNQFYYVSQNAELLDVSPSEFLRMVVNLSMSMNNELAKKIQERSGTGRENDTTNLDNIL